MQKARWEIHQGTARESGNVQGIHGNKLEIRGDSFERARTRAQCTATAARQHSEHTRQAVQERGDKDACRANRDMVDGDEGGTERRRDGEEGEAREAEAAFRKGAKSARGRSAYLRPSFLGRLSSVVSGSPVFLFFLAVFRVSAGEIESLSETHVDPSSLPPRACSWRAIHADARQYMHALVQRHAQPALDRSSAHMHEGRERRCGRPGLSRPRIAYVRHMRKSCTGRAVLQSINRWIDHAASRQKP